MKTLLFILIMLACPHALSQCMPPTVTSLTPASGPIEGGGAFTLSGNNFCPGIIIDFGATPATLTSITQTLIKGIIPPGVPGTISLSLSNPGVGTVMFNNAFTYISAPWGLVASAGRPVFGTIGLPVTLFGYASGGRPPYSYWWNFGDGAIALTLAGTHTYLKPGTFNVNFLITDANGEVAFSTTLVYITAPSTNYLTDDKGNVLTDSEGNKIKAE